MTRNASWLVFVRRLTNDGAAEAAADEAIDLRGDGGQPFHQLGEVVVASGVDASVRKAPIELQSTSCGFHYPSTA